MSSNQIASAENQKLGFFDNFSLWFSLGVGLLVMQTGSFLFGTAPTKEIIFAIILGSIFGSFILAHIAKLGQMHELNSAQIMTNTFGRRFATVPIFANIIQLIGWATFEFLIMSDGVLGIIREKFGFSFNETIARALIIFVFCAIIFSMLLLPMVSVVRRVLSKIALPLVILSLVWLTYQFLFMDKITLKSLFLMQGDNSKNMFSAIDLVVAMPISWLPLVCDYSRYGKSANGTFNGTFIGYVLANIWCYALGFVIMAHGGDKEFLATILLAQGGLIALGIILFDEMDNAYGDLYSSKVSIEQLSGIKSSAIAFPIVFISAMAAIILPIRELEGFLLILSSIFIPLYGVICGAFFGGKPKEVNVNYAFAGIWILGVSAFHSLNLYLPDLGASLPVFASCLLLSFFVKKLPFEAALQQ